MEACRLCGAPLPADDSRCPVCGMHQAERLSPSTRWRLVAGLAAVYAVVALALVLTR